MFNFVSTSIKTKYLSFNASYGKWIPIVFFVLGFIFDALVLRRIDELITLLQQSLYLLISFCLIALELIENSRELKTPKYLAKVWVYREALLHFLMGTLLNAYTIFYFKSASALTSLAFIGCLVAVLILNEFKRFGKFQTHVHVAILSLCLISFFGVLVPILMGTIGYLPFLLANVSACFVILCFKKVTARLSHLSHLQMRGFVLKPFALVQGLFILLYFLRVLPPVPLSVSYIGIYHQVKKEDSTYVLTSMNTAGRYWEFWQHGEKTFRARVGDEIFCFVRIFAPTRFKDELKVRWLYYEPRRGWVSADSIPLQVVGGRDQGFRGITKKTNYQPGDWRVQVETADGREIGRVGFTVEADTDIVAREETTTVQ